MSEGFYNVLHVLYIQLCKCDMTEYNNVTIIHSDVENKDYNEGNR